MIGFLGLCLVLAFPAAIVCAYLALYVLLYSLTVICRAIAWWVDR